MRITGRLLQTRRALHRDMNPLCVECQKVGKLTPWDELDHILPLHKGGSDTDDNLQGLCKACHKIKTRRDLGQRSRMGCDAHGLPLDPVHVWHGGAGDIDPDEIRANLLPQIPMPACKVIVVCGAPGSGKSTYVDQHKKPRDQVIDLDVIKSEISGHPIHRTPDDHTLLNQAIAQRNKILRSLSTAPKSRVVWFVVGAASQAERAHWRAMLRARVIVMETPLNEIAERIRRDPTRKGRADAMIQWAARWWDQYRRAPQDRVVTGLPSHGGGVEGWNAVNENRRPQFI